MAIQALSLGARIEEQSGLALVAALKRSLCRGCSAPSTA
jgi:hypothetical protein